MIYIKTTCEQHTARTWYELLDARGVDLKGERLVPLGVESLKLDFRGRLPALAFENGVGIGGLRVHVGNRQMLPFVQVNQHTVWNTSPVLRLFALP